MASFHHNLLADHTSRNPRFCGSRYTGKPDSEMVDFRNNVIYNWGNINSAYGGEGGHYNMVNNYYKPGPATPGNLTVSSSKNLRNRILQYTSYYYASDAAVYPDTLWGGQFYIHGNVVEGYPDVSADNWTQGVQSDGYYRAQQLMQQARVDTPFPYAPVRTQSAQDAYQSVLDSAGPSCRGAMPLINVLWRKCVQARRIMKAQPMHKSMPQVLHILRASLIRKTTWVDILIILRQLRPWIATTTVCPMIGKSRMD